VKPFFALELQQLLHIAMPELQAKYQSAFLRAHLCLSLPKELQDLVNFTADNLTWDHSISIEGLNIHVNTVSAIGNSWLTKEMVIGCDLNSIVCDFSSLDVCEVNNVEIDQPKMSTVMTVLEETVVRGNIQRLVKLFDGCAANRRQIEPGFSLFEPVRPFLRIVWSVEVHTTRAKPCTALS
jgi:hypothetical protein